MMKLMLKIGLLGILIFSLSSQAKKPSHYHLQVEIEGFKNDKGQVLIGLYCIENEFPEKEFKDYFKLGKAEVKNRKTHFEFSNLEKGSYAIQVVHDENRNGKIDKSWLKPKEGIGFSNYQKINPFNRPQFSKAAIELDADKKITIKIIYL